jgi:hypothetical protein
VRSSHPRKEHTMSRRLRQRREAIESRYVAMLEDDDTDEADWEDADYNSLRLYDEISEDSPSSQSLS